jgi:hypothetical protein
MRRPPACQRHRRRRHHDRRQGGDGGGSGTPGVGEIDVETREGIVQLSGFVSSADDVAAAAAVARTVKGVKSVRNDLRLK